MKLLDIYTVSFFGHREVNNFFEVEQRLDEIISELIRSKEYVEFLVGRNGEFDQLASSVVRKVKKRLDYGNSALILVLPNMTAEYRNNRKEFEDYYDEIEISEKAAGCHFKAAIQMRNREMAERSDLVVCCIERKSGGAYKSVEYAHEYGVKIINTSSSEIV